MKKKGYLIACLLVSNVAVADTAITPVPTKPVSTAATSSDYETGSNNSTAPTPTVSAPAKPMLTGTQIFKNQTGIDLSGYLDASYNYLVKDDRFISGNNDREFDLERNGFTLQQATLTFAKQPPTGLGGLLRLLVGRDAYTIASFGWNPNVFGIQNVGLDFPEAYLQYAWSKVSLSVGRIVSLPGVESYDLNNTGDTNFSRSILDFEGQPGTVTGVRLNYLPVEQLKLMVGLNNGWDTIEDTSRHKTVELGAIFTPNKTFSFTADVYSGQQRVKDGVTSGPTGTRTLIDLFGDYNVTENLNLELNYDYAWQTKAALPYAVLAKAVWQGVAGYLNYRFNDCWRTSFRGEIFDDSSGYRTGMPQNWRELTLTVGYSPYKDLEFRAETRHDFSNVNAFLNRNAVTASNNNQSYALEMLYKFS